MHIDESGRRGEARAVHRLLRRHRRQVTDRGDAVALQGNVGANRGRAAAIEHRYVADDEIHLLYLHQVGQDEPAVGNGHPRAVHQR